MNQLCTNKKKDCKNSIKTETNRHFSCFLSYCFIFVVIVLVKKIKWCPLKFSSVRGFAWYSKYRAVKAAGKFEIAVRAIGIGGDSMWMYLYTDKRTMQQSWSGVKAVLCIRITTLHNWWQEHREQTPMLMIQ